MAQQLIFKSCIWSWLANMVDWTLLNPSCGIATGVFETWAGRGARPRWLVAAIKEEKKLDDFLIDNRDVAAFDLPMRVLGLFSGTSFCAL